MIILYVTYNKIVGDDKNGNEELFKKYSNKK